MKVPVFWALLLVLGLLMAGVQPEPGGYALPMLKATDISSSSLMAMTLFRQVCGVQSTTAEPETPILDKRQTSSSPDGTAEDLFYNFENILVLLRSLSVKVDGVYEGLDKISASEVAASSDKREIPMGDFESQLLKTVNRLASSHEKIANSSNWDGPAICTAIVSGLTFAMALLAFYKERIVQSGRLKWVKRLAGWSKTEVRLDGLTTRIADLERLAGITAPNTPPSQMLPDAMPNLVATVDALFKRLESAQHAFTHHVGITIGPMVTTSHASRLDNIESAMLSHVGYQLGNLPPVSGPLATRVGATAADLTRLQDTVNTAIGSLQTAVDLMKDGAKSLTESINTPGAGLKDRLSSTQNGIGAMGNDLENLKKSVKSLEEGLHKPETGLIHRFDELNGQFLSHKTQSKDVAHT